MVLNSKKTKCLPFIMSRTKDFIPELSVKEGTNLDVIYSMKLVGMMVTSKLNLGWQSHVDYTVTRINKVLWQLVRFKQLGGDREKITKVLYSKSEKHPDLWSCVLPQCTD